MGSGPAVVIVAWYSPAFLIAALASSAIADVKVVNNSEKAMKERGGGVTVRLSQDLVIGKIEGADHEMFGRVSDIVVDTKGSVYVADVGYQRVHQYDNSGAFVRGLGHGGEGPGEYRDPFALTTDPAGNLYVASRSKVSIFDEEGNCQREFRHGLSGAVRKIRIDRKEGVYISCFELFSQQIIHRYSLDGGSRLSSFCESYAAGSDLDTRVEQVSAGGAIDIRGDGLVYFTQMTPYEIRVYSAKGQLLSRITRENDFMTSPRVEYLPEGGMKFHLFPSSVSIVMLEGERFINVVIVPRESEQSSTILDVFDGSGTLIGSLVMHGAINVRCRDAAGRLYASERDDYPKVVRYRVSFQ